MQYKLRPKFIILKEEPQLTHLRNEEGLTTEALMFTSQILWKNNQVMTSATGNSKRQAERNAGVEGLRFLELHPELKISN